MANPTAAAIQALINAGQYVQINGALYGPLPNGNPFGPSQPTIDAYYAANAAAVLGEPLATSHRSAVRALGNPVQTALTDAYSLDAGDDYNPWSNNFPIKFDKYGNMFTVLLRWNGNNKRAAFAWKNVGDTQFTINPILSINDGLVGELALDQGEIAYDATNDIIHFLWVGQDSSTGVLYRRYIPIRDGSNHFTGIDWDYTDGTSTATKLATRTNLQLDFNGSYDTITIKFLGDAAYGQYGALVAMWGARTASGSEMRASMCVFGSTAQQGKTAGNWTNIGLTTSNSAFGCTINVAYNAIVSRSGVTVPILPVFHRKRTGVHQNDVYLAYSDTIGGVGLWRYTRLIWASATHNWTSQTTPVTICNTNRGGTDTGYSLKYQLMSGWAEDNLNDRMYVGIATWKDNANGDTWSFAKVDNADALTLVDVHSAGGAHFYAPTGSVAFDQARGLLVVAYDRGSDAFGLVRLYKDTSPQGSAVVATTTSVDVPALMLDATAADGTVPLIFRDIVNTPTPPYHGWWVTLTWQ